MWSVSFYIHRSMSPYIAHFCIHSPLTSTHAYIPQLPYISMIPPPYTYRSHTCKSPPHPKVHKYYIYPSYPCFHVYIHALYIIYITFSITPIQTHRHAHAHPHKHEHTLPITSSIYMSNTYRYTYSYPHKIYIHPYTTWSSISIHAYTLMHTPHLHTPHTLTLHLSSVYSHISPYKLSLTLAYTHTHL